MTLREVKRDGFHFVPGLGVTYEAKPIKPGMLSSFIIGSCMSADGAVVPLSELLKVSRSHGSVKVTVCRIRQRLADFGVPREVLETVPGEGMRWNWAALEGREAG